MKAMLKQDRYFYSFFRQQEFHVLSKFKEGEIILELLKQEKNDKTYKHLISFAFALSIELGGRYFGKREHFEVPKVYREFRDYMYHDMIPFLKRECHKKVFSVIRRRRLELLRMLLEEKRLGDFLEDDRYKRFHAEVMSEGPYSGEEE